MFGATSMFSSYLPVLVRRNVYPRAAVLMTACVPERSYLLHHNACSSDLLCGRQCCEGQR